MLENLRFHLEEEKQVKMEDGSKKVARENDVKIFCKILSQFGDIFVNDAFGAMHRGHSSINGIQVDIRVGGLLVKKELLSFAPLLSDCAKIDLAILGGSKVSDKIKIIKSLIPRVNNLYIGGGMAFTFLKRKGVNIGKSIFDQEGFKSIDDIYKEADHHNTKIILPSDHVIACEISENSTTKLCDDDIPENYLGLDIGPKSIEKVRMLIKDNVQDYIFWNGPVGVFELEPFSQGTRSIVHLLEECTSNGIKTIVAGGDSIAAANKFNAADKFTHLSTGGGASMELLEGKVLPGIAYLNDL